MTPVRRRHEPSQLPGGGLIVLYLGLASLVIPTSPLINVAYAGLYAVRSDVEEVLVRPFRNSWAIGTLKAHELFDVLGQDHNWVWGYAYGSYRGCAWTYLPKLVRVAGPPAPHQDCGPPHRIALNASERAPKRGYGGGRLTDAFSVKESCDGRQVNRLPIFRNYRSGEPRDPYAGTLAPHSPIGWRYTKGGDENGYAMIRYHRGNKWGFVKRSCIAPRGGRAAVADTFDGWNECEAGEEDSELCVDVCGDEELDPGEQCDLPDTTCGSNQVCRACHCLAVSEPFPEQTFTRTPNGTVYRTAGRSPVQLFTCSATGYFAGCPAAFWNAPQDFVDALRTKYPVPVDGAYIRRPDGTVFRFVGGAPVQLFSCASSGNYPGCSGIVDLDGIAVDRLIQARWIPRDGALLRKPDGSVFQMRCGRAEYVHDCSSIGGCGGFVDVDGLAVDRLTMKTGCDDGDPCTSDLCEALVDCRQDFGAHCVMTSLSPLLDDACGDGVVDATEQCDDGNATSSDGCSPTCHIEPAVGFAPISGLVLSIRDPENGSSRRMRLSSVDASIDPDAWSELGERGAVLQLFNDGGTGESVCLTLAPAGWRAKGSGSSLGYVYRDPDSSSGPCASAALKRGKLKVVCRGDTKAFPFSLDEPQQRAMGLRLSSGTTGYCMQFGGTVVKDLGASDGRPGSFEARRAPSIQCSSPPRECS